jgi:hypothetical protein
MGPTCVICGMWPIELHCCRALAMRRWKWTMVQVCLDPSSEFLSIMLAVGNNITLGSRVVGVYSMSATVMKETTEKNCLSRRRPRPVLSRAGLEMSLWLAEPE